MSDSIPLPIRADFHSKFSARWGFVKGLLAGVVIEVPAIAGLLWVLARWGLGDPDVPFARLLQLTALFAGTAAILTAGGVGRLAAHMAAPRGRSRAVLVAARAHAVAFLALVLIAAIPHRHLPASIAGWLAMAAAAALVGATTGAAIGLVCSGPAPVGIADVVALARTPGHALQHLLDPEDLRRLGAAMRLRTGHLITAMFEPAAPPPAELAEPPKPPATEKPVQPMPPPSPGGEFPEASELALPPIDEHGGAAPSPSSAEQACSEKNRQ